MILAITRLLSCISFTLGVQRSPDLTIAISYGRSSFDVNLAGWFRRELWLGARLDSKSPGFSK